MPKDNENTNSSTQCPLCGAVRDEDMTKKCPHCGAHKCKPWGDYLYPKECIAAQCFLIGLSVFAFLGILVLLYVLHLLPATFVL